MAQSAKKLKIAAVAGFAILAAAVVFAAVAFTNNQSHTDTAAACPTAGASHGIIIEHNEMAPSHVTAPRCDRLMITNKDSINRLIAFGPHEHHVAYDGVTERLLTPGQSLSVTLDQIGNFEFHDHLHDEVQGTLMVTRR